MNTVPVTIDLPLFTEGNIWGIFCCFVNHKWVDISGGPIDGRECSRCRRAEFKFGSMWTRQLERIEDLTK